jgi:hypothetical protein
MQDVYKVQTPISTVSSTYNIQPTTSELDTIVSLLIFLTSYAFISTMFLCYFCSGFSCKGKKVSNDTAAISGVPVIPLLTTMSHPPTVLSSTTTESLSTDYPGSLFSEGYSTYGPSCSTVSDVHINDLVINESYV